MLNLKIKQTSTNYFNFTKSVVYFLSLLVAEKLSQTSTIPLGIFLGWTLWADGVSLQMNTIASCDQFKSVRITENLLVN